MTIHEQVHETITNHKNKIQLTQWAIMSSIASLVYSEYLKNIRQKQHPRKMILVPTIRSVQELLLMDGPMFERLSLELIEAMSKHFLIRSFAHAPELELFKPYNIEIMKTIFELYMLPTINLRIPETIARKFDLLSDTNQLIREDREIDLFNREPFTEEQFQYIVNEAVLQLLILLPTMKKEVEYPERNTSIFMTSEEIITISNENAVTPIHFDCKIISDCPNVMNLLSFVTNSTFTPNDHSIRPISKQYASTGERSEVEYEITTGIFNSTSLTRLIAIEKPSTEGE